MTTVHEVQRRLNALGYNAGIVDGLIGPKTLSAMSAALGRLEGDTGQPVADDGPQITQEAIDLIKEFEGWRATAYKDAVGVWTIGYGHTSMAGAPTVSAGMRITKEQGEEILRRDLVKYEDAVRDVVKVPLTANQFGALVSWCYNVGPGNVAKSTLVKKLNAGNYSAVPSELAKWNKAGGKTLNGLVRRRAAEAALWNA